MAASSFEGASFVWKTTPKDPLPTILHWVYWISRVSPVTPSCTFSRITSVSVVSTVAQKPVAPCRRTRVSLSLSLTSHPQGVERCRPV